MLNTIKPYIYFILITIFLVLSAYCKYLKKENDTYITNISILKQSVIQQSQNLKICSDNTQSLKLREIEIDNNAKTAIIKVQTESLKDRKLANDILFSKAKVPVITKENTKNFGGPEEDTIKKDYLSTHQLANEYIDNRNLK